MEILIRLTLQRWTELKVENVSPDRKEAGSNALESKKVTCKVMNYWKKQKKPDESLLTQLSQSVGLFLDAMDARNLK